MSEYKFNETKNQMAKKMPKPPKVKNGKLSQEEEKEELRKWSISVQAQQEMEDYVFSDTIN